MDIHLSMPMNVLMEIHTHYPWTLFYSHKLNYQYPYGCIERSFWYGCHFVVFSCELSWICIDKNMHNNLPNDTIHLLRWVGSVWHLHRCIYSRQHSNCFWLIDVVLSVEYRVWDMTCIFYRGGCEPRHKPQDTSLSVRLVSHQITVSCNVKQDDISKIYL